MRPEAGLFVSFLIAAVVVIISALTLRYRKLALVHKERMACIERGAALPAIDVEQGRQPWSPRVYLLRGLMWTFGGASLAVFLLAMALATQRPRSLEDRIYATQRLRAMGATEEQMKSVQTDTSPVHGMTPAAALIGLIPFGIGLAYLLYYRSEKENGGVRS